MPLDALPALTQFGVAGLMGTLWVWERMLSRKREAQLHQTHERLMQQTQELRVLVKLVRQNTLAIARFDQTQKQLNDLLERISNDHARHAA